MSTDGYKKIIILCSILAAGIVAISVIYALKGDAPKDKGKGQNEVVTAIESPDPVFNAAEVIITAIDLDSSSITVEEIGTGKSMDLIYTGGSDIRTKSKRIISVMALKKGNMAKVTYDDSYKLISLYGHEEVWGYKNAENIRISRDPDKIEVGSNIYRYDENIKVLNDDEFITLDSLALDGTDVVDLYGIGDRVYLVNVGTGHGYLTLSNSEEFLGGLLYYGLGKSVEITDDLNIMLREGEYDIRVENGDYSASATVRITNNDTTCFDLSEYGPEPIEYGQVQFNIRPQESDLYVDGVKTEFTEPVNLPCGVHEIEVVLGGYIGYKGVIEVSLGGTVKNITLSPRPTEAPQDLIYDEPETATDITPEATPVLIPTEIPYEVPTVTPTQVPVYTTPTTGPTTGPNVTSIITQKPTPTPYVVKDDYGSAEKTEIDFPDSTTDDGDNGDIEVLDGDEEKSTNTEEQDKSEIENFEPETKNDLENEDNIIQEKEPEKMPEGNILIINCTDGTDVYINGEFRGVIASGSLTTSKPKGTIELVLKKEGYVTKNYTLTLDDEEEEETFKFPQMTARE